MSTNNKRTIHYSIKASKTESDIIQRSRLNSIRSIVTASIRGSMMEPDNLYWPRWWFHHGARRFILASLVALPWSQEIYTGLVGGSIMEPVSFDQLAA